MRLLFIDVYARYLNPTNSLHPGMLRLACESMFYGPGFVDSDELDAGVERFIEKHGPFDVVATPNIEWNLAGNEFRFYHRYTWPTFDAAVLQKFSGDISAFMKRTTLRKIIFLTGLDVYAINDRHAGIIADEDAYFVTWAAGFSRPLSDLPVFAKEEFYARKSGQRQLGVWHQLVEDYKEKFISLGHYVAENEFFWGALSGRSNQVIVPGQGYERRRLAHDKLRLSGRLRRTGYFRAVMATLDRLHLRPYARPLLQNAYNAVFVQEIRDVRYAYTDGYGYDRPIRKFFEIPALGTILLCTPCAGFRELGFVDRQSAVEVDPEYLPGAIEWLDADPVRAQTIAAAGRDLIWDKHSTQARARQFSQCLTAIQDGTFRGSSWRAGNFVVDTVS
jgi:hypothetical protein